MNRVVCYVQRSSSGHSIDRMRLVAPGLDRQWAGDSALIGAPAADLTAQVGRISAAARWIDENLRALGADRLDTLCIDPEGAVCTWFSAASPDEKVVSATLAQSAMNSGEGAPGTVGGGGSGGAAGRLAMLASSDPATASSELTLQPLAVSLASSERVRPSLNGKSRFRRSSGHGPAPVPGRFALLSIPDACIRVLIDALDDLRIEIGSVTSLWHVLAAAFDPSAADRVGAEANNVVALSDPATAVILIDPRGRMVWSWSRAGMLVAGGAMRLRLISPAIPPDSAAKQTDQPADDVFDSLQAGTARRLTGDGKTGDEEPQSPAPEASVPEVGRLVADWLAWAAQLGASPQRVVCFGPPTQPRPGAQPEHPSFGQALAKAWPGATVDLAEHEDPIGLALQRLAGLGRSEPQTRSASDDSAYESGASDPRLSLTALSNRPGRVHRRMQRWAAAAIAVAASLVAVWGFQLHRAADRAQTSIDGVRAERTQVLEDLDQLIPNISRDPNPERSISARLNKLDEQARAVRPAPPLFGEVVRLLNAFGSVQAELPEERRESLRIQEMSLSSVAAVFRLDVPDSETGPRVEIAVKSAPGIVQWSGRAPPTTSGAQTYILTGIVQSEAGAGP